MGQTKTKGKLFTENWIPVKGIKNNMIYTYGNYKVAGVKIIPRNIFILDVQTQNNVMIQLKNFYNTIDYEFWLVVADRPVDISVYMSQLQLLYNNAKTPAMRKFIQQDMDKGTQFMRNDVVDTEYYILFKDNDDERIMKKVRSLINNLSLCGLSSAQANNDDLRVILDNFLNGGKKDQFGMVMI